MKYNLWITCKIEINVCHGQIPLITYLLFSFIYVEIKNSDL